MTFSVVQAAHVEQSTANPALVFGSPLTEGNFLVVFWAGDEPDLPVTANVDDDSDDEAFALPEGWARLYRDGGGRFGGYGNMTDAQADANTGTHNSTLILAVYGHVVAASEGTTVTFRTLSTRSTAQLVQAYELSGSFDPEFVAIDRFSRATSRANLLTALTTDADGEDAGRVGQTAGPGLTVREGSVIFAAVRVVATSTMPSSLARSMSADRTDAHTLSGPGTARNVLSVSVIANAAADTYRDDITWTTSSKAAAVMLALHDKGEFAAIGDLPTALGTIADAFTGVSEPAAATSIDDIAARLDRTLTRKNDLIAAHAANDDAVFLAPHAQTAEAPVHGEAFSQDPDRDLDGPDIGFQLCTRIIAMPTGWRLRVPRGRYRLDQPQLLRRTAAYTIEGEGLGADLPTFYRTQPRDIEMLTLSGTETLGVKKVRFEGSNTSRTAAGIWGAQQGAIGQNLFRYIPQQFATPLLADDWADYNAPAERNHGMNIVACRDVTVEDYFAYGTFGEGITFNRSGVEKCVGVTASRLDVRYAGRQSIAILGVVGMTLDDWFVTAARRSGIDIEDSDPTDVVISNGYVDAAYNTIVSNSRTMARNITISGLTLGQGGDLDGMSGPAFFLNSSGGAAPGIKSNYLFEDVVLADGEWYGGRRDYGVGSGDPFFFSVPLPVTRHGGDDVEVRDCNVPIARAAQQPAAFSAAIAVGNATAHDNVLGYARPAIAQGAQTDSRTNFTFIERDDLVRLSTVTAYGAGPPTVPALWLAADEMELAQSADVFSWTDGSENENDFAPVVTGTVVRPQYRHDFIGGRPAVAQLGTSAYLRNTDFEALVQPYVAMFVIRDFVLAAEATTHTGSWLLTDLVNGYGFRVVTDGLLTYAGSGGSLTAQTSVMGTPHIGAFVIDGADSAVYVDGVQEATADVGADTLGDVSTPGLAIGPLAGGIAEVVVFSDAADLNPVGTYLAVKYGLTWTGV